MSNLKPKIFIVDDIATNIDLLTTIMSVNGYKVLSEQEGINAFEQIKSTKPDLVLLDIMMPDMDGYEVCKQILNDEETKSIPVIFITGLQNQNDIIKGFDVGGVDYITKPFNPVELLSRVKTHLELKFAKDQLKTHIAEKDKFFSIVASEMSSNFNSFMGLIEILSNEHKNMDSDEHDVILKNVSKSGNLLRDILDKLFIWSQIHTKTIEIQNIKLSCKQIIDEALFGLSVYAKEKHIEIETNLNNDFSINVDYHFILNIAKDIIHNAIKFTDKNGKITISLNENNGIVSLSIQDTGVGIEQSNLDKIFRIDTKFKGLGTIGEEGIGLDMIIAKALIELMNGSINILSEVGIGTTVTVSFPKV